MSQQRAFECSTVANHMPACGLRREVQPRRQLKPMRWVTDGMELYTWYCELPSKGMLSGLGAGLGCWGGSMAYALNTSA